MSTSMHVEGIREPDDRWRQMKAVYDACAAASVDPPADVVEFFDGEAPDEAGIKVSLDWGDHRIAREWRTDYQDGLEINVADLPPQITKIRFYLS